eukprot:Gb_14656 [translate_table: standard]
MRPLDLSGNKLSFCFHSLLILLQFFIMGASPKKSRAISEMTFIGYVCHLQE